MLVMIHQTFIAVVVIIATVKKIIQWVKLSIEGVFLRQIWLKPYKNEIFVGLLVRLKNYIFRIKRRPAQL